MKRGEDRKVRKRKRERKGAMPGYDIMGGSPECLVPKAGDVPRRH